MCMQASWTCPSTPPASTAGIIELKLEEHDLLYNTQIFTKKPGDALPPRLLRGGVHPRRTTPSRTPWPSPSGRPIGTVIHTGDFKIDLTPIQGEHDRPRRASASSASEGVLRAALGLHERGAPGLHATRSARSPRSFDELFKGCDKRIIVTTFASNVQRIQQIVNVAAKYKRKVAVTGPEHGEHDEGRARAGLYGHPGRRAHGPRRR